jgi:hypothetical protein
VVAPDRQTCSWSCLLGDATRHMSSLPFVAEQE